MSYRILTEDRKAVVNKVKELTGEKPMYTGLPRMAYFFRGIMLEKNGTLTLEEGADRAFLKKLVDEGVVCRAEDTCGTTEDNAGVQDETNAENESIEGEELSAESTEQTEDREIPPADNKKLEDDNADIEENARYIVAPEISFPVAQHRAESLCNLIFTLCSRGKLISKSTGGDFYASRELAEKLETGGYIRTEDVVNIISEVGANDLRGLRIGKEKVTFTGFPPTDDNENIGAWTALASAINKTAIKQKRVRAKKVDDSNEKFAFRTWLTRLGMSGAEFKAERNILYKNLNGHTAFRTDADRRKWEERQNKKRREKRESKAEERKESTSAGQVRDTE